MTQEHNVVRRGDSFDIGSNAEVMSPNQAFPKSTEDIIVQLASNPSALIASLGLTETQAKNVASIIAGTGAGLGYKYLSNTVGDEIAGAIGGLLGAYLAKKVTRHG